MFELDELAYRSACLKWSPTGKFVFVLTLLISSLLSKSLLVPIVIAVIGIVLLGYSIRFRFPKIIGIILLDAIGMMILGAIIIAAVTPGDTIYNLDLWLFQIDFSNAGIFIATLVTMRALAGMSVMLFFATSTPIPYFADMLVRMKVPKEFAELMTLVYRYSFMLFDELEKMYLAAQCRLGFRGKMNSLRTYAKMLTGMFIRSIETAERQNIGMQCRNYQSSVSMLREPKGITYAWGIVSVIAFLGLFQLNLMCVHVGLLLG
ncbi:MAG: cobalt ECF transporter T component CbiQ [Methanomassiliicoccales archaeon]|nr:cobalt ECF transporter T component CbiQ [Methanomassiliicoccales archaeon]